MNTTAQPSPTNPLSSNGAHLGQRVKELRLKRGLSQMKVAAGIGCSLSALHRLERTGGARVETVQRLAALFGVTTDDLIGC